MSAHSYTFIHADEPGFASGWERFFKEYAPYWQYGPNWQAYLHAYTAQTLVADHSFIVTEQDAPVAICPLHLEDREGVRSFSNAGWYLMAPATASHLTERAAARVEHECYCHIDQLASREKVAKCLLMTSPVAQSHRFNPIIQHNYLDASGLTAVVRLCFDKPNRWARLRKSFKAIINKGLKTYELVIMDHTNPDWEMHEEYRLLHHKSAGRVTRKSRTFDILFEELSADRAALIGLRAGGKFVALSYFLHDGHGAYYGSAADDPDFDPETPLEHAIIWSAIEYYAGRGRQILDIGAQHFGPQIFLQPTPKDYSMGFFKRGFGAELRTAYRGVKYYDPEILEAELCKAAHTLAHNCDIPPSWRS